MGEMYPLWMLKYLPNMPACHIGIRYDARGPNNTIAQGDVSSLMAIAEAAEMIRRDLADVMIVGGTGSRINITDLMWHAGARVVARWRWRSGRGLPAVRPEAERHGLRRRGGRVRARKPRPCGAAWRAAAGADRRLGVALRTDGRVAAADRRRDSPGDPGGAGGGEARIVPHRSCECTRQQHARRRSGRGAGDSRSRSAMCRSPRRRAFSAIWATAAARSSWR